MHHHLTGLLFPFLLLLLIPATSTAQRKALPDGLWYGIRMLNESDEAFRFRRERPIEHYRLRFGVGPQVQYAKGITKRLGAGAETGVWVFWNRSWAMDATGEPFRHRAIVFPLMVNVHYTLVASSRFELFVQASGGVAYNQFIRRYAEKSRVDARTTGITGLSVVCWIGLWRAPQGTHVGPRIGVSQVTLDGSPLHCGILMGSGR